jgi:hypothetical protein
MEKSKAVLELNELIEHLSNEDNHYLYKKEDDNSITCYMCCDFDVVDCNEFLFSGVCGSGVNYNFDNKEIRRVNK